MTDLGAPRDPPFATTRWSVVVAAADSDAATARAALSDLCRAYWYPLYADARRRGADVHDAADLVQGFFATLIEKDWVAAALSDLCCAYWYPLYADARRRGESVHDAADLVQGFFAALIEKDWVAAADPERGRFRAFLVTAFRHFASNERAKARADKRGGGDVVSLDVGSAESRLAMEPIDTMTPERAFERRFALTLLARVLTRVRAERPGDADLLPFVGGPGAPRPYAEIAAARATTEGAVKTAVHRLRAHWRDVVRAEVRDVVAKDADVDDEIRHLLEVVAG